MFKGSVGLEKKVNVRTSEKISFFPAERNCYNFYKVL